MRIIILLLALAAPALAGVNVSNVGLHRYVEGGGPVEGMWWGHGTLRIHDSITLGSGRCAKLTKAAHAGRFDAALLPEERKWLYRQPPEVVAWMPLAAVEGGCR